MAVQCSSVVNATVRHIGIIFRVILFKKKEGAFWQSSNFGNWENYFCEKMLLDKNNLFADCVNVNDFELEHIRIAQGKSII